MKPNSAPLGGCPFTSSGSPLASPGPHAFAGTWSVNTEGSYLASAEGKKRGCDLLFRCDASSSIGLGHLSRCASLARAAAELGLRSAFLLNEAELSLPAWIHQDIRARVLNPVPRPGDRYDLAATRAAALRLSVRWVVVDTYAADESFFAGLQGETFHVCVIDDLADRNLSSASLLINPTPGSELWAGRRCRGVEVLAGSSYALLHRAFSKAREDRGEPPCRPPQQVLVTLGGSDPRGLSGPAVRAVGALLSGAEVSLVLGPAASPAADELDTDSKVTIFQGLSPQEMAGEMAKSDLAIASPSTTAWELSCLGVPTLAVVVAENQRRNATVLAERSLCEVVEGDSGETGISAGLKRMLGSPFGEWAHRLDRWRSLCDGLGAERVARRLLSPDPAGPV